MRAIAVTVIGFLLSGAAVAGDQPGKQKKQKNEKHAVVHQESRDSHVAVHVVWSTHDIDIVRRHYAPQYRNLPPGLQKKYARTGQLPPGWQKKMQPLPAMAIAARNRPGGPSSQPYAKSADISGLRQRNVPPIRPPISDLPITGGPSFATE